MDSRRRYFGRLGVVLVVAQLALIVSAQDCLLAAGGRAVPFRNDNGSPRLPNGTQAIITSYKFECCGNITAWLTYVQPGGGAHQEVYDITFQVWRPSPTVQDGCYSMVGENRFTSILFGDGGLVSETPEPSNILTVQPGDVVGYMTFSSRTTQYVNGEGIQLDTSRSIDSVWYHTNNDSEPFIVGVPECPLPVGAESGRSLTFFTNAGPVLSVSVSSFSCQPTFTASVLQISNTITSPLPTPTTIPSHTSTTSPFLSITTSPVSSPAPTTSSAVLSTAVVASVAAVGGSALLLTLLCTLVLAITITKAQHKRQRTLAVKSTTSDQQVSTHYLMKMQGNEAYTPTSHIVDECYASTTNTESHLYDTVNTGSEGPNHEYDDVHVEPLYY